MVLQKDEFTKYMRNIGYSPLAEKRLDQGTSNTLFIGASIMAHMELLNKTSDFKYVTEQRVVNSQRLNDIGKYPLATPFEVMLSIFMQQKNAFAKALKDIINFLYNVVNINKNKIIILAPNDLSINQDISNVGINKENIVHWNKDLPLFLNDENKGKYVKLFYPYHDGLMPIGTLGIIKRKNKEFIDSALFLERLSFMKDNKNNWFETTYFKATMNSFPLKMEPNFKRSLCIYLRTLLILYYDQIHISHNQKGYVVKKIMRNMFSSNPYLSLLSDKDLKKIVICTALDLKKLEYVININVVEKLISDLTLEMRKYEKAQLTALKNLNRLSMRQRITSKDLLKLHDEQGLSIAEIEKWAKENSIFINEELFKKKPKYWLRNELYKFINYNNRKSPQKILEEAGKRRL